MKDNIFANIDGVGW